ncbi:MAG: hypothetical protein CMO01_26385 [Thalassobius sp.]|nr:hypothetical protein [Thalassovita sp.]
MKKLLLLITFKLLLLASLIAQENFQAGYIIKNSGEKITGEIDNEYWRRNPETITFKNGSGETQTYGVNDIKEFQVDGNIYKSASVQIETSSQKISTLDNSQEPKFEDKKVFLETIIQGTKSLYSYRGEQERDYYFIYRDGKYEALVYKKFNMGDINNVQIGYNKQFVLQLRTYLGDCPDVIDDISIMDQPSIWKLKKLFAKYYSCTSSSPEFQKVNKETNLEWGVDAGITFTSIQFNGDGGKLTGSNFSSSVAPTFGIFLNIGLDGNRKKWAINNALLFTSFSTEGNYINNLRDGFYNEYDMQLEASYLKLQNLIRYSLLTEDNKDLYLLLGISNGFLVNIKNTSTEYRHVYDEVTTSEVNTMDSYRSYEQGLVIGAGYNIKYIHLNLKFERSNGLSDATSISSPINRIYTTVGYSF